MIDTATLIIAIGALSSAIVYLWKKQERDHDERKRELRDTRSRLEICEERTERCEEDRDRLWGVVEKLGGQRTERKNDPA